MRFDPFRLVLLLALALPVTAAAAPSGIPNFHQVTDRIYRGGQPEDGSWSQLSALGVRTVLDLRQRSEHSTTAESLAVRAAGMDYVNFPMNGFATPTATQLSVPLSVLDAQAPVFVHCKQGRDRTGTVIAAYRISRQGWENHKALAEAQSMGMHWFENGMKRFIASYRLEAAPSEARLAQSSGAATDSTSASRATQ